MAAPKAQPTTVDELIAQARKVAQDMGGLIAVLLAVSAHKSATIFWDKKNLKFALNGKLIGVSQIRVELERVESKLAGTIKTYMESLFSGKWTVEQWRSAMDSLIGGSHAMYAALAVGGLAAVSQTGVAELVVRKASRDLRALAGFQDDVEAKRVPVVTKAVNRGKSYLRSIYVTYHVLDQRFHNLQGYEEAKNILRPAEHCHSGPLPVAKNDLPGCVQVAELGWIRTSDMIPIGSRRCGQYCKCYLIFRKKPEN